MVLSSIKSWSRENGMQKFLSEVYFGLHHDLSEYVRIIL